MTPFFVLLALALLVRRRVRQPAWKAPSVVLAFGAAMAALLWVVTGHLDLFLPAFAGLLALPGDLTKRPRLEAPPFFESRAAVVLAGLLSALAVVWVWGSADPVAMVHDEKAYLLQAGIFASGHWTGPGRPLPEFFEQMHVFVTPVLVSKYPPGHSLLLSPGVRVGVPILIPVLLNAIAGGLVFAHARRISGAAVAAVTWILWVTAPATLAFRASYLSENTSTVLWLASLWALREWLAAGRQRWLVLLAFCLGWGALTRPMTMFAFALPIGAVLLRAVIARRAWRDLGLAALVGTACLCLLPIWNLKTMGNWRTSPYREYSRVYFPYEWTGFGVRTEPALRQPAPGMEPFERQFKRIHAEHTVRNLPQALLRRLVAIGSDQWGSGRGFLGLFALLGVVALNREGVFGLVSSAVLVLAYLFFAHSPAWTAYYADIQPFLAFVTAVGLCGLAASLWQAAQRFSGASTAAASRQRAVSGLLAAGLLLPMLVPVWQARDARKAAAWPQRAFQDKVARLADSPSIVFVRNAAGHNAHRSLVENVPDLATARAWLVYDLGERNRELARIAPERKLYLYDERTRSLAPIAAPSP